MSYRKTKHHVETSVAGIAGEWTITARVYLCDPNDRHDANEVDEWLTATRVPSRKPKFRETWCSQCGAAQGPGDSGVSSCTDHRTSMDAEEFLATATDVDRQKLADDLIQTAIDCYEPTDRELADFYRGGAGRPHRSGIRELL